MLRLRRGKIGTPGFTLIELLVVIAIIAVLAAILFPVFAQARESARRATCTSNVKQLALGVMLYTQDYDEKFPLIWTPGPPLPVEQQFYGRDPTVWTWQNHAMSYIRSHPLHHCPSGWSPRSTWSGVAHRGNGGYGANDQVVLSRTTGGLAMAALLTPAETYLIMDSGNYQAGCGDFQDARHPANYLPGARWNEKCFDNRAQGDARACRGATRAQALTYWSSYPDTQPTADLVRDALDGRHHRRLTVAFCDGHVASTDPDRVLFDAKGWFDPPKAGCIGNPPLY